MTERKKTILLSFFYFCFNDQLSKMVVEFRRKILTILILIHTGLSLDDSFFIRRNCLKLINAFQDANKKLEEQTGKQLFTFKNCSHSSTILLNITETRRKADKIIDDYLKEFDDWKMFKNIDAVLKIL